MCRRPQGFIRWPVLLYAALVALFIAAVAAWFVARQSGRAAPLGPIALDFKSPHNASYVGGDNCRECHQQEYDLWQGSHHDLAMKPATDDTVLGDFDNATFTQHGVVSTFFREGDDFIVRTEGEDGQLRDYRVLYTFGWTPLQQYLVEFPGGRLQTLPLCWDSRPKGQGGGRWFHIYGEERIPPGDPLFWTGPNQNWNFMCAECHSTNLKKRFDAEAGAYHTTWSQVNVSCEACHGPGSAHVKWAQGKPLDVRYPVEDDKGLVVRLRDLSLGAWQYNNATGYYERTKPLRSRVQAETCARCHSRRATITEDYAHGRSIHDTHQVETLAAGLYHDDGQILDEVYVYGSFVQSRMYRKGVRCVDCHEPHGTTLRETGNQLCAKCHKGDYDSVKHHFHPKAGPVGSGTQCVDCHMIQRTYMQVDPRRDHSFRVPRPDLPVAIGAPNACNDCHRDQTAQWAADYVEQWYGPRDQASPHYGLALHAARQGTPDAVERLARLVADPEQPGIARATGLLAVGNQISRELFAGVVRSLTDSDPMVRAAAVAALRAVSPGERWRLAGPLLDDPIKSVRMEAVSVLAAARPAQADPAEAARFDRALAETIASHRENLDRASGYFSLGLIYGDLGQTDASLAAYERAVAMEPWFLPGVANLTMLYRQLGREDDAHRTLASGVANLPDAAALRYELGMSFVRRRQIDKALAELQKAAELDPQDPRYSYGYAVALHSTGQPQQALDVLDAALERRPHDRPSLYAAISFCQDLGLYERAAGYVRQLLEYWPDDPAGRQFMPGRAAD